MSFLVNFPCFSRACKAETMTSCGQTQNSSNTK